MHDLTGKVAFVAGAGSDGEGWGNGRATAVLLARQGAKVFGTDRSSEALEGTARVFAVEGMADRWGGAVADMTKAAEVEAAVNACMAQFSRVDILVNNIGGSAPGTPVTMSLETWDAQMDVNLKTAFLGCKYVLPVMERQFETEGKGGAIVNVSSIAHMSHQVGGRTHVAYAASKAGLMSFSRSVAISHVKKGIRSNVVVVGMMNTPLVVNRLAKQLGKDVEELVAERNKLIPMGRMGDAFDIANAVLFLASDESGYITGTQIVVDGGVTAAR